MSAENVKRFKKEFEENEEFKEKVKKELEAYKDSGKNEREIIPEIAVKLGYDFTNEEFEEDSKELSANELENVSGGMFWFGEDAPDGHEVGCFFAFYLEWSNYYYANGICEKCKSKNVKKIEGSDYSYLICNDCNHQTSI
ncbi:nif11-like leader peptide domain-containing protein [Eubacterium ruminantium]|nr:nif11-like leader peptide domain-containing protein [Eubacterium ruminantium]